MIDGNVRKQTSTMTFLQLGVIFDLQINGGCGLRAEQRRPGINHHDKRCSDASRVHVRHKIVTGFIDHAVEEFRYNHILCATRFLPCPAFGRTTEEAGWQKFASPNMAVTINNLHFLFATLPISCKSRSTPIFQPQRSI